MDYIYTLVIHTWNGLQDIFILQLTKQVSAFFFKLASLLATCLITDSNLETSKAKELGKIVNAWKLNNMPREHIKEEIKVFLEANVDSDTTYESL